MKPRNYQERVVNKTFEYFSNKDNEGKAGLIIAPVGTGKSIIAGLIAHGFGHKTVVLQPSLELLQQNSEKLSQLGGTFTVYSAKAKQKEISDMTFATIGSVKNLGKQFKEQGVDTLIVDECFPGNTLIQTDIKYSKITTLKKNLENGEEVYVKSFNEKTKKFENKKLISVIEKGIKPIWSINFKGKYKIYSTDNHKYLTVNGWKELKDLKKDDALLTNLKSINSIPTLNSDQYDFVIGSILGDGCARTNNSVQHLSFTHGFKQKEYIKFKAYMFNQNKNIKHIKENGISKKEGFRFNTKSFYFPFKNNIYEFCIDNLNEKSLAILWQDDGHLAKLQNSGSLYSLCNNKELVLRLQRKLKDFGIVSKFKTSISKISGRENYYLRFNKEAVYKISEICAKFTHPSMDYKIVDKFKTFEKYLWSNKFKNNVRVVDKIENTNKEEVVFDLSVEDNHNFIVCSNNIRKSNYIGGIVAHNCNLFPPSKGSMFRTFVDALKPKYIVGLTATPCRLYTMGDRHDNYSVLNFLTNRIKNDHSYFKNIIDVIQIEEIYENYWSPIEYELYDFDEGTLRLNSTGAEFTEESIKKAIKEQGINNLIFKKVKELNSNGIIRNLIFCDSVETAKKMASIIPKSAYVSGDLDTEKREKIINDFKNGNIYNVFNYGVLTSGFDYPELSTVILGRPSNSYVIIYQSMGRVVRIHENKNKGLIIDFCNNVKRFGRLEDLSIEFIKDFGWGMFNNEILLTNIRMGTAKITKSVLKGEYVKDSEDDDIKFWFGKHNGKKPIECPLNYLKWFLEEFKIKHNSTNEIKRLIFQVKRIVEKEKAPV